MRSFLAILILAIAGFCTTGTAQEIIYATTNGQGSGASWQDATSLTSALRTASAGQQIWVRQGTYLPTSTADRSQSFVLSEGVALYGGFKGTESTLEQRDHTRFPTILSGAIGSPDISDNSYTVVRINNATAATIIDGFTITEGYSNGSTPNGTPERCGGGLFVDGRNGSAMPTIKNCVFRNNSAREGGAVYNYGNSGNCSPRFVSCAFRQNAADLDGGAIFNDGSHGGSDPILVDCDFEDNMASYGAGIFSQTRRGSSKVDLEKCTFKNNLAYLWGGGIYGDEMHGTFDLKMDDCQFNGNYPTDVNKEISIGMIAAPKN